MKRFQIRRSDAWKIGLVTLGSLAVGGALLPRATAQTVPPDQCSNSGKACGFAISDGSIQKMTPLFKLQAQIAQAKLPVGDAKFETLKVNVLSGATRKCTETFNNVQVRSGTLNLEIGRSIDCAFDDVIAKYNDLAFQVCIGDGAGDNCLKPIQMSSVPYAIKANYASQAQSAYQAELASRANYAQRLSSDSNLLDQKQLGEGYFEVQTPGVAGTGTGTSDALKSALPLARKPDVKGGFLYWAPVDTTKKFLNLSAKNLTSRNLEPLEKLLVHAGESSLWGNLFVNGGSTLNNTATFNNGWIAQGVGTLQANVPANFTQLLTATGGLAINTGALTVASTSTFSNTATFAAGTTVDFTGANVVGLNPSSVSATTLSVSGKATFNGGVDVNAAPGATLKVATPATFQNGLTVTTGTVDLSAATVKLPTPQSTTLSSSSGCQTSLPITAKFCALTHVEAIGSNPAFCVVQSGPGGTTHTLYSCSTYCKMSCF